MEYRNVIKNVLDRHQDGQGNMSSDSFRDMLSVEISSGIELEKENNQLVSGTNQLKITAKQKRDYEFIQKGEQMELFPELVSWIYESPDGGKTITKRKQGEDYTKRILVTDWEAEKENIVRRYN